MNVITRTKEQVYKNWITALRSGEYKQGTHQLKDQNNNFCCLGVLCDLAAKDGGEQWDGENYGVRIGGIRFFPPDHIVDFMTEDVNTFQELASMNDEGKSFEIIADYIEKEIMPVECP